MITRSKVVPGGYKKLRMLPKQTTIALSLNICLKHTGQAFKRALLEHLPFAGRIEILIFKLNKKASVSAIASQLMRDENHKAVKQSVCLSFDPLVKV